MEFLFDEHPANFASPNTLNNVVQFGPMIFAGYSWMLVCVAGYSFESSGISAAWWGYLPHQFLHRARKVWPIHGKDFVPGTDTLEHLQVFLDEEIILFFNLLRRLVPLCRPAQLAYIACLGTSRVVCSCFGNTSGTCQSQCLQCAENMLPVWLALDSPLMQCQCPFQESDCSRYMVAAQRRQPCLTRMPPGTNPMHVSAPPVGQR